MDRPVMFRAGRAGAAAVTPRASAAASGPAVYLADVSEFQPDLADAAYLAWSKAVIIRAAYGAQHDDGAWYGGARRDALHAGGVKFLGIYIYVAAAQDPAAQAEALIHLVGPLRKGEKIILDIEEGTGDLRTTRDIMSRIIVGALGDTPWTYSGLYFATAHNLAPVEWLADYTATEPAEPHTPLWQFTDSYQVPGVGTCDCSVFHGTISQLAALAWQGTQAVNPVLRQGMTGAYVKTLQGRLNAFGYGPLTADGIFGPLTKRALERFQSGRGLTPDGICGPLTWAKLGDS
jgi:GH25 family lysozyme M1 (1,4-beta-N-acetylmuramidase)